MDAYIDFQYISVFINFQSISWRYNKTDLQQILFWFPQQSAKWYLNDSFIQISEVYDM